MSKENLKIIEKINNYYLQNHKESIKKDLKNAYQFAEMAYFGEVRKSGRTALEHSLATAEYVSKYGGDKTTILAALLHDVYLHGATLDEVESEVDLNVAELLNNYLHIQNLRKKYGNMNASGLLYSEYTRRIILVYAQDMRAVMIRLCERIDSISDSYGLSKVKQRNLFNKILKVYAPLADLIGFYSIRKDLEEGVFKVMHPDEFTFYSKLINEHKVSHKKNFDRFLKKLYTDLSTSKVKYSKVFGRVKSPYSFYKKVKRYMKKYKLTKQKAIEKAKDNVAYSIICDDIENCYKALDILHTKYEWDKGEFDDYIKNPKPNGFRALQTKLEITGDTFVEVQIKTEEMHEFNEFGPASHTYYKIYGDAVTVDQKKIDTIKNLVGWKDNLLQGKGFSTSKIHSTILAITPKGDVFELDKGSTPIDFAYKVHTRVGDRVVRAMVNGKQVSLGYQLKDGDVVKIITQKNSAPKYKWLDFVKTKEARISIKKKLKKMGKI